MWQTGAEVYFCGFSGASDRCTEDFAVQLQEGVPQQNFQSGAKVALCLRA